MGPRAAARARLYPEHAYDGTRLGHGDRPERLHRLQRLRRSPARRRTTSRSSARSRSRSGREMHWIRIDRYFEGDGSSDPSVHFQPVPVHALRERPVRGGLPGGGDGAQRRGPERHGLQPLRRHALLLEQLPVQGAALQLPATTPTGTTPEPCKLHAQSGRHRAQPRRDGEVHLLRAAHQRRRAIDGQERGPAGCATARSSPPASRPARRRRSSSATSTTRTSRGRHAASSRRCNYALLAELNTQPRTTYLARDAQPEPGDSPARSDERRSRHRGHVTPPIRAMTPGAAIAGHRPGHTLRVGHRQDQRHRAARGARRWRGCGFGVGFMLLMVFAAGADLAVLRGRRHLGHQHPGRLGLRHRQLRLVDRHRPRRHADLGDPAAAAARTGARRSTASPRR